MRALRGAAAAASGPYLAPCPVSTSTEAVPAAVRLGSGKGMLSKVTEAASILGLSWEEDSVLTIEGGTACVTLDPTLMEEAEEPSAPADLLHF